MGDGAQIIIARRIGEERISAIGRVFGTSFLTNVILAVSFFGVLHWFLPSAIIGYSKNQEIALLQGDFLRIRSFALFFAMITITIQAFLLAKGKSMIVLYAALITAISNIFLANALIFGKFGLPEMGIEGAALANTIAEPTFSWSSTGTGRHEATAHSREYDRSNRSTIPNHFVEFKKILAISRKSR
jgi:Na+-driven multidrug efflux pump